MRYSLAEVRYMGWGERANKNSAWYKKRNPEEAKPVDLSEPIVKLSLRQRIFKRVKEFLYAK